jgi:Type II secretion system (T2SS), protein G
MPVTMTCRCGKMLDIDEAAHGNPAQCPMCGNVFVAGAPISTTTAIQDGEPDVKAAAPIELPKFNSPDVPSIEKPWLMPQWGYWVLLGILVTCIGLGVLGFFLSGPIGGGTTKSEIAQFQVKSLSVACDAFRKNNNRWPNDLTELLVPDANGIVYVEDPNSLKDPWGRPYQYDVNGPKNNGEGPDIWTVMPSGKTIGNWPHGR